MMIATRFSLVRGGELIAYALVCPNCKYAALLRPGSDWIERRETSHRTWREINRELTDGFAPGPLPRESDVYKLLALGTDADLLWMQSGPVKAASPRRFSSELDARLRQSAVMVA
jgi:hypothetical protein